MQKKSRRRAGESYNHHKGAGMRTKAVRSPKDNEERRGREGKEKKRGRTANGEGRKAVIRGCKGGGVFPTSEQGEKGEPDRGKGGGGGAGRRSLKEEGIEKQGRP